MIAKIAVIEGKEFEFYNIGRNYHRCGVSGIWNKAMQNLVDNYTAEIRVLTRSIMS